MTLRSWARGSTVAIFAMVLTSIVLVWWLDPALHDGSFDAALLWRNAPPVFLVIALIYGLSGRTLRTLVLGGVLVWIVFEINAIKELNLDEPVLPGDLVLWHQVLHNMGFFENYTRHPLVLLLALLVFVALLWAVRRMEHRLWRPHWMSRVAWVVLSLTAIVTLYRGEGVWRDIYADEALPGFQLWDPIDSVEQVGLMAGLVRMSQEAQTAIPKGRLSGAGFSGSASLGTGSPSAWRPVWPGAVQRRRAGGELSAQAGCGGEVRIGIREISDHTTAGNLAKCRGDDPKAAVRGSLQRRSWSNIRHARPAGSVVR